MLAEGYELGGYNPVNGYAESGVSPIYDGLYRPPRRHRHRRPRTGPALADRTRSRQGPNRWRMPLRSGVTFSDGSAFDSADVVATYAAVRDPAVASEISTSVAPIVTLTADGPDAVTVEMNTAADPRPYLLLGHPAVGEGRGRSRRRTGRSTPSRSAPARTGWRACGRIRPSWSPATTTGATPAQVKRVVYTYTPDDNARAQAWSPVRPTARICLRG